MNSVYKLAIGSIFIGLLVFGLKYLAYVMTGSVALYSDALETVVNVLAAGAALWAIHVAQQPPDADHPFGHHKAEYFSAWLEGALIALAAAAIMLEAWQALFRPRAIAWNDPGLLVNASAGIINALWSHVLIRQGRKLKSPALVADGKHLRADVITTIGVLGGLLLAAFTGWYILDPIIAMLVAAHILREGWHLLWESTQGLMDVAPDEETLERIRKVIREHAGGAVEFHALKARRAGAALFVEFHLVVPGDMRVRYAHDICDAIEHALAEEFGEVHASIHVEPDTMHQRGRHDSVIVRVCSPCRPADTQGKTARVELPQPLPLPRTEGDGAP